MEKHHCPNCKELLIARTRFSVRKNNIVDGKCAFAVKVSREDGINYSISSSLNTCRKNINICISPAIPSYAGFIASTMPKKIFQIPTGFRSYLRQKLRSESLLQCKYHVYQLYSEISRIFLSGERTDISIEMTSSSLAVTGGKR